MEVIMGKIIVLNGKGHEVETEDLKAVAMRLLKEGYQFWQNVGTGDAIELGTQVAAKNVTARMVLVAMKPLAGG